MSTPSPTSTSSTTTATQQAHQQSASLHHDADQQGLLMVEVNPALRTAAAEVKRVMASNLYDDNTLELITLDAPNCVAILPSGLREPLTHVQAHLAKMRKVVKCVSLGERLLLPARCKSMHQQRVMTLCKERGLEAISCDPHGLPDGRWVYLKELNGQPGAASQVALDVLDECARRDARDPPIGISHVVRVEGGARFQAEIETALNDRCLMNFVRELRADGAGNVEIVFSTRSEAEAFVADEGGSLQLDGVERPLRVMYVREYVATLDVLKAGLRLGAGKLWQAEHVRKRRVVVLLGETQVGKTTVIGTSCGLRMEVAKVAISGPAGSATSATLEVIRPVPPALQADEVLMWSSDSWSDGTAGLRENLLLPLGVRVVRKQDVADWGLVAEPLRVCEGRVGSSTTRDVFVFPIGDAMAIADISGTEDTAGLAMDVANTVQKHQVVAAAAEVRVALVVGASAFENLTALEKALGPLEGFLREFTNAVPHLAVVITKTGSDVDVTREAASKPELTASLERACCGKARNLLTGLRAGEVAAKVNCVAMLEHVVQQLDLPAGERLVEFYNPLNAESVARVRSLLCERLRGCPKPQLQTPLSAEAIELLTTSIDRTVLAFGEAIDAAQYGAAAGHYREVLGLEADLDRHGVAYCYGARHRWSLSVALGEMSERACGAAQRLREELQRHVGSGDVMLATANLDRYRALDRALGEALAGRTPALPSLASVQQEMADHVREGLREPSSANEDVAAVVQRACETALPLLALFGVNETERGTAVLEPVLGLLRRIEVPLEIRGVSTASALESALSWAQRVVQLLCATVLVGSQTACEVEREVVTQFTQLLEDAVASLDSILLGALVVGNVDDVRVLCGRLTSLAEQLSGIVQSVLSAGDTGTADEDPRFAARVSGWLDVSITAVANVVSELINRSVSGRDGAVVCELVNFLTRLSGLMPTSFQATSRWGAVDAAVRERVGRRCSVLLISLRQMIQQDTAATMVDSGDNAMATAEAVRAMAAVAADADVLTRLDGLLTESRNHWLAEIMLCLGNPTVDATIGRFSSSWIDKLGLCERLLGTNVGAERPVATSADLRQQWEVQREAALTAIHREDSIVRLLDWIHDGTPPPDLQADAVAAARREVAVTTTTVNQSLTACVAAELKLRGNTVAAAALVSELAALSSAIEQRRQSAKDSLNRGFMKASGVCEGDVSLALQAVCEGAAMKVAMDTTEFKEVTTRSVRLIDGMLAALYRDVSVCCSALRQCEEAPQLREVLAAVAALKKQWSELSRVADASDVVQQCMARHAWLNEGDETGLLGRLRAAMREGVTCFTTQVELLVSSGGVLTEEAIDSLNVSVAGLRSAAAAGLEESAASDGLVSQLNALWDRVVKGLAAEFNGSHCRDVLCGLRLKTMHGAAIRLREVCWRLCLQPEVAGSTGAFAVGCELDELWGAIGAWLEQQGEAAQRHFTNGDVHSTVSALVSMRVVGSNFDAALGLVEAAVKSTTDAIADYDTAKRRCAVAIASGLPLFGLPQAHAGGCPWAATLLDCLRTAGRSSLNEAQLQDIHLRQVMELYTALQSNNSGEARAVADAAAFLPCRTCALRQKIADRTSAKTVADGMTLPAGWDAAVKGDIETELHAFESFVDSRLKEFGHVPTGTECDETENPSAALAAAAGEYGLDDSDEECGSDDAEEYDETDASGTSADDAAPAMGMSETPASRALPVEEYPASLQRLLSRLRDASIRVRQDPTPANMKSLAFLAAFAFTWVCDGQAYLKHRRADAIRTLHNTQIAFLLLVFGVVGPQEGRYGAASVVRGLAAAGPRGNGSARLMSEALMRGHLVELPSGEGKSIALCVCAMIYALLGARVDVVCYSKILTGRDALSASRVLSALELDGLVRYLTLDELMELRAAPLRAAALAILQDGSQSRLVAGATEPTMGSHDAAVLLFDEVDSILEQAILENGRRSERGVGEAVAPGPVLESVKGGQAQEADDRVGVLLLDEVDSILEQSVLSGGFGVVVRLFEPTFAALLRYVYERRKDATLTVRQVRSSTEFAVTRRIAPEGSQMAALVDQAVIDLVACRGDFGRMLTVAEMRNVTQSRADLDSDFDHVVDPERGIGYLQPDGSVAYGTTLSRYRSALAYLEAVRTGAMRATAAFDELYLSMPVLISVLKHSDVPRFGYAVVHGVSGSFSYLTKHSFQRLQELCRHPPMDVLDCSRDTHNRESIDAVYVAPVARLPSIYRRPDEIPNHFALVAGFKEWSADIMRVISAKSKLTRESESLGHPVVVFFENRRRLRRFRRENQKELDRLGVRVEQLTAGVEDAEGATVNATLQGQVTLATREFGRGVDYRCGQCESLTIVLAYLPLSLAEEEQVRRRTCRQGSPGEFHFIVLREDAEAALGCLNSLHGARSTESASSGQSSSSASSTSRRTSTCRCSSTSSDFPPSHTDNAWSTLWMVLLAPLLVTEPHVVIPIAVLYAGCKWLQTRSSSGLKPGPSGAGDDDSSPSRPTKPDIADQPDQTQAARELTRRQLEELRKVRWIVLDCICIRLRDSSSRNVDSTMPSGDHLSLLLSRDVASMSIEERRQLRGCIMEHAVQLLGPKVVFTVLIDGSAKAGDNDFSSMRSLRRFGGRSLREVLNGTLNRLRDEMVERVPLARAVVNVAWCSNDGYNKVDGWSFDNGRPALDLTQLSFGGNFNGAVAMAAAMSMMPEGDVMEHVIIIHANKDSSSVLRRETACSQFAQVAKARSMTLISLDAGRNDMHPSPLQASLQSVKNVGSVMKLNDEVSAQSVDEMWEVFRKLLTSATTERYQ